MAVETVLMYNCNGEQWAKLRQIFLMLRCASARWRRTSTA